MMDEKHELLIQKCVDGELDVHTQQELLARLDHLVDGWRVLALAYVEEQSWAGSFNAENAAAEQLEETAHAGVHEYPESPGHEAVGFVPHKQRSAARSGLVTQVTCVAIALVGGILLGDIWRARNPAGPPTGPGVADAGNQLTGPDQYDVQVPASEGGSLQVPAYRGDIPADPGGFRMPAASLNQELRKEGFQLLEDRGVIVFELDTGERILMPLESMRIAPSGQ